MHPAYSVIFFTTASGAGYGVLVLLGLMGPLGFLPDSAVYCTAAIGTGLILVTSGLLSSTAHLGHPERAWRAITQWRSSWLSREGVAAIFTYPPALAFGGLSIMGEMTNQEMIAGFLMAVLAVITVICTGMIYASLPTIRAWSNRFTVPIYLLFMLSSGTPVLVLLTHLLGAPSELLAMIGIASLIAAWGVKRAYWQWMESEDSTLPPTPETATGLGRFGSVRPVEAPHTSENFLMREMGYQVARTRAAKLKRIAFLLGLGGAGAFLALGSFASHDHSGVATLCYLLATIASLVATGIERWLFFAEARHAVTLYYGARSA